MVNVFERGLGDYSRSPRFEVPVNKMKVQLSTEVYAFVYLLINVIHRSLRIKRFCWDQKFKTQSLNIKKQLNCSLSFFKFF